MNCSYLGWVIHLADDRTASLTLVCHILRIACCTRGWMRKAARSCKHSSVYIDGSPCLLRLIRASPASWETWMPSSSIISLSFIFAFQCLRWSRLLILLKNAFVGFAVLTNTRSFDCRLFAFVIIVGQLQNHCCDNDHPISEHRSSSCNMMHHFLNCALTPGWGSGKLPKILWPSVFNGVAINASSTRMNQQLRTKAHPS